MFLFGERIIRLSGIVLHTDIFLNCAVAWKKYVPLVVQCLSDMC